MPPPLPMPAGAHGQCRSYTDQRMCIILKLQGGPHSELSIWAMLDLYCGDECINEILSQPLSSYCYVVRPFVLGTATYMY